MPEALPSTEVLQQLRSKSGLTCSIPTQLSILEEARFGIAGSVEAVFNALLNSYPSVGHAFMGMILSRYCVYGDGVLRVLPEMVRSPVGGRGRGRGGSCWGSVTPSLQSKLRRLTPTLFP